MPWSDQKQSQKKYKVSYRVIDGRNTTPFGTFKPPKDTPVKLDPVDTSSIIPYSEKTSSRNTNLVENILTRGLPISTNTQRLGYDRLQLQNAKNTLHTKATGGQSKNFGMRQGVKQAPIEVENPMSANNVVDSLKLEIYQDGNPFIMADGCGYGIDVISVNIQAELQANVNDFQFIGGNGSYKQLINSGDYSVNIDFTITPGGVTPLFMPSSDMQGGKVGTNPIVTETEPEFKDLKQLDGLMKKTKGFLASAGHIARTISAVGTTVRQVSQGNLVELGWLKPSDGMVDYDLKPDNELQLLCTMFRFICKYPYQFQLHVTNRYLNMLGVEYLCPVRWRTDTTDDFTNTYRLSLEAHGEYGY